MFTIKTKHDHINKTGIYAVSKRVKKYDEVKETVEAMIKWMDENNKHFPKPYEFAYAISHCQVADEPWNFFIVDKEFVNTLKIDDTKDRNVKNFYFPARAIFNAKILEAPDKVERDVPRRDIVADRDGNLSPKVSLHKGLLTNKISVPEACMSFPNRTKRDTERYYRIKVSYQVKGFFGLRTVIQWVEGLKAHIFQHEIQHARGENMYFHK